MSDWISDEWPGAFDVSSTVISVPPPRFEGAATDMIRWGGVRRRRAKACRSPSL
jgi:hypothetical protein